MFVKYSRIPLWDVMKLYLWRVHTITPLVIHITRYKVVETSGIRNKIRIKSERHPHVTHTFSSSVSDVIGR